MRFDYFYLSIYNYNCYYQLQNYLLFIIAFDSLTPESTTASEKLHFDYELFVFVYVPQLTISFMNLDYDGGKWRAENLESGLGITRPATFFTKG